MRSARGATVQVDFSGCVEREELLDRAMRLWKEHNGKSLSHPLRLAQYLSVCTCSKFTDSECEDSLPPGDGMEIFALHL